MFTILYEHIYFCYIRLYYSILNLYANIYIYYIYMPCSIILHKIVFYNVVVYISWVDWDEYHINGFHGLYQIISMDAYYRKPIRHGL